MRFALDSSDDGNKILSHVHFHIERFVPNLSNFKLTSQHTMCSGVFGCVRKLFVYFTKCGTLLDRPTTRKSKCRSVNVVIFFNAKILVLLYPQQADICRDWCYNY